MTPPDRAFRPGVLVYENRSRGCRRGGPPAGKGGKDATLLIDLDSLGDEFAPRRLHINRSGLVVVWISTISVKGTIGYQSRSLQPGTFDGHGFTNTLSALSAFASRCYYCALTDKQHSKRPMGNNILGERALLNNHRYRIILASSTVPFVTFKLTTKRLAPPFQMIVLIKLQCVLYLN